MKKLVLIALALGLVACSSLEEFKPLAGHYRLEKGDRVCPENIDLNVSDETLTFYIYNDNDRDRPALTYPSNLFQGERLVAQDNEGVAEVNTYGYLTWKDDALTEHFRTVVHFPMLGNQETEKGIERTFHWTADRSGLSYHSRSTDTDLPCDYRKSI